MTLLAKQNRGLSQYENVEQIRGAILSLFVSVLDDDQGADAVAFPQFDKAAGGECLDGIMEV